MRIRPYRLRNGQLEQRPSCLNGSWSRVATESLIKTIVRHPKLQILASFALRRGGLVFATMGGMTTSGAKQWLLCSTLTLALAACSSDGDDVELDEGSGASSDDDLRSPCRTRLPNQSLRSCRNANNKAGYCHKGNCLTMSEITAVDRKACKGKQEGAACTSVFGSEFDECERSSEGLVCVTAYRTQ
jgi:hypothetical protein